MHVLHYSDIIPRNYCCSEMENAFFLHYHYCLDKSGFTLIDKSAQVALFCFSSIGLCFGCKMSGSHLFDSADHIAPICADTIKTKGHICTSIA